MRGLVEQLLEHELDEGDEVKSRQRGRKASVVTRTVADACGPIYVEVEQVVV